MMLTMQYNFILKIYFLAKDIRSYNYCIKGQALYLYTGLWSNYGPDVRGLRTSAQVTDGNAPMNIYYYYKTSKH